MKVLVTEGTGFIGRLVLRALLNRPDVSVVATTTDMSNISTVPGFDKKEWLEVDLAKPKAAAQLPAHSIDTLIHLAWSGLPNSRDFVHLGLPGIGRISCYTSPVVIEIDKSHY